ncbi:MAG: hypothetical protein JWO48_3309 [Bryobacterales bacterium]|nr:hypothetical protein [Bryobacterales bacterium]
MATLASSIPPAPAVRKRPGSPLPLEAGDRLTREEFLTRYAAMHGNIKAERIEGIVHMPAAAVSADFHGVPHAHLMTLLGVYRAMTPGTEVADNTTIHLDLDNDPQPDACLRIMAIHGGQSKVNKDGFIVGSPELAAEVSSSSASYDLNAKLNAYRRNGVREYLVYRVYDGEIDWFTLRDGQYDRLVADGEGVFRSLVFPGLWLKAQSLIDGDLAEVLQVLQRGLAGAKTE